MSTMFTTHLLRLRPLRAGVLLLGLTAVAVGNPLRPGIPAPTLEGARWLHGEPLTRLPTGQVHVVEFRAPPTVTGEAVVPVLTATAGRFAGRASFISVSVPPPNSDPERIEAELAAFIRFQGPRLNYAMALDATNRSLYRAWLETTGATNLPQAFVVGRDGNVAWIGRPGRGLDESLAATLDSPLQHPRALSAEAALRQEVATLRRDGKPAEALAALEAGVKDNPGMARTLLPMRLSLMFQLDPGSARQEIRTLAEGLYRNDPQTLNTLANMWLVQRGEGDPGYALTLAQRACEQTTFADSSMVTTLARAQTAAGQPAKAVETLTAQLKRIEDGGGKQSPQWNRVFNELAEARKAARLPPLPEPGAPSSVPPK